jgi:hypothetical protein
VRKCPHAEREAYGTPPLAYRSLASVAASLHRHCGNMFRARASKVK